MNMDEQHLEMTLAGYIEGARVVKVTNDGYYAILPAQSAVREGLVRSAARLQYLGGAYVEAHAYILRRWEPQRA